MSNYQINTSALSDIHTARSTARQCAIRETAPQVSDFEGWVTLRLNFSLTVTFLANIYGPLDRGMVILQLCCWKFLHKETVADFIRLKLTLIQKKTKKSLFEPPFGDFGTAYAFHLGPIARSKAHGRLPIRHN